MDPAPTEIYTLSLHDALPISMLWDEQLPRVRPAGVEITVTAGALSGVTPLAPPPDSWAANPESDLAIDRKSTRLNSSHSSISYAVFCLKKKTKNKKK